VGKLNIISVGEVRVCVIVMCEVVRLEFGWRWRFVQAWLEVIGRRGLRPRFRSCSVVCHMGKVSATFFHING
jgi:hypothetical protein